MEGYTSLILFSNCCRSLSEPVYKRNMSSIYLRNNVSLQKNVKEIYVSSNIPIRMFAYVGAQFVPIVHPFICKFVQLDMKLIIVSTSFKKLIITLDGKFFLFIAVSTALRLSLLIADVQ